jgi:hypothetical protein
MKALIEVLEDSANQDKTTEEIAELLIDSLDAARGRTHRLVVVGQISYATPEGGLSAPHTVVLGPYSARGVLDSQEKFDKAIAGGTAAREAGQSLAWDSKTGTGKGRFMLAPAFLRPRDAWDFFRPEKVTEEEIRDITQSIAQWQPHVGVSRHGPGPVCHCACSRPGRIVRTSAGDLVPAGPCPVHPDGASG